MKIQLQPDASVVPLLPNPPDATPSNTAVSLRTLLGRFASPAQENGVNNPCGQVLLLLLPQVAEGGRDQDKFRRARRQQGTPLLGRRLLIHPQSVNAAHTVNAD